MLTMSDQFCFIILVMLKLIALAGSRRVFQGACGGEATFYRIANDHILDEEPIAKNVTNDLVECMNLCVNVAKCVAMNTHKRSDNKIDCHLLKDDHLSMPRKVTAKNDWNLYDTGSKEISRKVFFYTAFCQCFILNHFFRSIFIFFKLTHRFVILHSTLKYTAKTTAFLGWQQVLVSGR